MQKLPYKNMFVVVILNGLIRKIFFDEVRNFDNYSNLDFDDHHKFIAKLAENNDSHAENLFIHCCESYLNNKEAIRLFKIDAKKNCRLKSQMCVVLIFDISSDENELNIQLLVNAYDENRGAFNYIAKQVSHEFMKSFVDGLSREQQDLLFEYV